MRFSIDDAGARRQPDRFRDDADRLPAAAWRRCRSTSPSSRWSARFHIRWSLWRSPGRCSAPFFSPWSASSCRAWSSRTSASRPPSARNWSMARTTRRRAQPPTLAELFANVRRTTSRSTRTTSISTSSATCISRRTTFSATLMLVPTLAVGKITLRCLPADVAAFSQVRASFQYLVNSWPTIVELISIYKRLRAFEATLEGEPLPEIDRHYLEREKPAFARRTSRRLDSAQRWRAPLALHFSRGEEGVRQLELRGKLVQSRDRSPARRRSVSAAASASDIPHSSCRRRRP